MVHFCNHPKHWIGTASQPDLHPRKLTANTLITLVCLCKLLLIYIFIYIVPSTHLWSFRDIQLILVEEAPRCPFVLFSWQYGTQVELLANWIAFSHESLCPQRDSNPQQWGASDWQSQTLTTLIAKETPAIDLIKVDI